MTFIILEKYCKDVLDCKAMDLLGIKKVQWHQYKKTNYLPLKHFKTVCTHFNHHITDDWQELTNIITKAYYAEVMV